MAMQLSIYIYIYIPYLYNIIVYWNNIINIIARPLLTIKG